MCLDSTYSSQDKVSLLYHRKANICQHDYWSRIILAWVMKKAAYHLWFVVSCSSKNHAPHFLSKVYLQIVVFYWYWVKYITISLGSWLYIYNLGQRVALWWWNKVSWNYFSGKLPLAVNQVGGSARLQSIRLLARKGTDCPLCVVLYCVHYNTHRTDSSNSQQHKEKNSCYDDHIKLKLSLEGWLLGVVW